MMRLTCRILLSIVLWASACLAQVADLPSKLDQLLAGYQKNRAFIGSALVAKGGKILLAERLTGLRIAACCIIAAGAACVGWKF